ncbi:uncharacterized protein LOC135098814 [Scylla paramamosain]
MSEAETSSTGFCREGGGKQQASLPPARSPSSKTLDARSFESDANSSSWDDDPGIMSKAETFSTGRSRNVKPRTSLPIVHTPSKTLERPLGPQINNKLSEKLPSPFLACAPVALSCSSSDVWHPG